MGFQIGAPIQSDNQFFGRKDDLQNLKKLIDEYYKGVINHVALIGLRRIGKSSLVKKIERVMQSKGLVVVYLDLEKVENNAAAFFTDLYETAVRQYVEAKGIADGRAFLEEAKLKLKQGKDTLISALKKTKLSITLAEIIDIGVQIENEPPNWRKCGKQLFALLERLSEEEKIVIMIDEFGLISKYTERIELLEYLRGLLSESKVPFILTGSHNIMRMVPEDRNFWSAVLLDYRLGFWKEEDVCEALQSRFKDEGYHGDFQAIAVEVFKRTNGHPLHVNILGMMLEELTDKKGANDNKEITPDLVQIAYEEYICGKKYERQGFGYYHDRLTREAKQVLRSIAINEPVDPAVLPRLLQMEKEVVQQCMQDLEYDFYLDREKDGCKMMDPLFRDWLRRKFGA
jgi:hypothetical protein